MHFVIEILDEKLLYQTSQRIEKKSMSLLNILFGCIVYDEKIRDYFNIFQFEASKKIVDKLLSESWFLEENVKNKAY